MTKGRDLESIEDAIGRQESDGDTARLGQGSKVNPGKDGGMKDKGDLARRGVFLARERGQFECGGIFLGPPDDRLCVLSRKGKDAALVLIGSIWWMRIDSQVPGVGYDVADGVTRVDKGL